MSYIGQPHNRANHCNGEIYSKVLTNSEPEDINTPPKGWEGTIGSWKEITEVITVGYDNGVPRRQPVGTGEYEWVADIESTRSLLDRTVETSESINLDPSESTHLKDVTGLSIDQIDGNNLGTRNPMLFLALILARNEKTPDPEIQPDLKSVVKAERQFPFIHAEVTEAEAQRIGQELIEYANTETQRTVDLLQLSPGRKQPLDEAVKVINSRTPENAQATFGTFLLGHPILDKLRGTVPQVPQDQETPTRDLSDQLSALRQLEAGDDANLPTEIQDAIASAQHNDKAFKALQDLPKPLWKLAQAFKSMDTLLNDVPDGSSIDKPNIQNSKAKFTEAQRLLSLIQEKLAAGELPKQSDIDALDEFLKQDFDAEKAFWDYNSEDLFGEDFGGALQDAKEILNIVKDQYVEIAKIKAKYDPDGINIQQLRDNLTGTYVTPGIRAHEAAVAQHKERVAAANAEFASDLAAFKDKAAEIATQLHIANIHDLQVNQTAFDQYRIKIDEFDKQAEIQADKEARKLMSFNPIMFMSYLYTNAVNSVDNKLTLVNILPDFIQFMISLPAIPYIMIQEKLKDNIIASKESEMRTQLEEKGTSLYIAPYNRDHQPVSETPENRGKNDAHGSLSNLFFSIELQTARGELQEQEIQPDEDFDARKVTANWTWARPEGSTTSIDIPQRSDSKYYNEPEPEYNPAVNVDDALAKADIPSIIDPGI